MPVESDNVKRAAKGIVSKAQAQMVQMLIDDYRDDLQLVSPSRACGILDVSTKTLAEMRIPRIVIVPNKVIRYRLSDISAYLERHIEE